MRKFFLKIDGQMFWVPAIMTLIVLAVGVISPETFGVFVDFAFNWISDNLGWMYQVGLFFLLVFCLWAGFSKVGKIRLGGKSAKPNMSMLSWITITFTSGMALGVVFYGVGEGLSFFMEAPSFAGYISGSAEAAEHALRYVFFHWGLHPYAIYTSAGLGFAFVYWNTKRSFTLSSGLYPLMGEKGEKGWAGKIINWFCLYVMVATLGTNVGMAALQLTAGFEFTAGKIIPEGLLHLVIIVILCVAGIVFACSGIHKGIKYVSNTNMIIFSILLLWAFLFGGTQFALNNTVSSVGQYLSYFLEESFYLEPAVQSGWIKGWTLFYWAWWLTVAPLTGLFLIKLAKGRTIRQFVMVNMFVPIGFIVMWFGIFGSTAIYQQMNGAGIWEAIQEFGFPVAMFAYLKELPWSKITTVLGFLAVFFSFTTQNESMVYTMAGMTTKEKVEDMSTGEQKSPHFLKVFWGVAISAMGYILLKSGGLDVVQRSVVMLGLPIMFILIINAIGFIKATTHREKYDLTLTDEERAKLIAQKENEI